HLVLHASADRLWCWPHSRLHLLLEGLVPWRRMQGTGQREHGDATATASHQRHPRTRWPRRGGQQRGRTSLLFGPRNEYRKGDVMTKATKRKLTYNTKNEPTPP